MQMETVKKIFRVDRREINYLQVTVESYDGMAVLKTIDPKIALVELQISPGCENWVYDLLNYLVEEENINIKSE